MKPTSTYDERKNQKEGRIGWGLQMSKPKYKLKKKFNPRKFKINERNIRSNNWINGNDMM